MPFVSIQRNFSLETSPIPHPRSSPLLALVRFARTFAYALVRFLILIPNLTLTRAGSGLDAAAALPPHSAKQGASGGDGGAAPLLLAPQTGAQRSNKVTYGAREGFVRRPYKDAAATPSTRMPSSEVMAGLMSSDEDMKCGLKIKGSKGRWVEY